MRLSAKSKTRNKGGGRPPAPPIVPNYTLTVTTSGTGGGTATGAGTYPAGTTLHPTATPDGSSDFTGWTGAVVSSSSTLTFQINANMTINAVFTAVTGGGGSGADDTGVAGIDSHMSHSPIKQDLATAQDPCPGLWVSVTDPFVYGPYDGTHLASSDPYVDWLTTAPVDTHVARGQSAASSRFRRLKISDPPVQDSFDSGAGNSATRTQLVHNSTTSGFYVSHNATHNWHLFSHRRHGGDGTMPNNYGGSKGGSNNRCMVCQWKCPRPTGSGSDPVLAINEWKDGYQLLLNNQITGAQKWDFFTAPNNTWIRFYVDVTWSSSGTGAISLWADPGGGAPARKIGPWTTLTNLYSTNAAMFSIGPYCDLALPVGPYNSDFANVQVLAYT